MGPSAPFSVLAFFVPGEFGTICAQEYGTICAQERGTICAQDHETFCAQLLWNCELIWSVE